MKGKYKILFYPNASNGNIQDKPQNIIQENDLYKQPCPCCGHVTIPKGGECTAYICPICCWEMDSFIKNENEVSDQNHGLTLVQAQTNYKVCGAVLENLKIHCRLPLKDELP